MNETIHAFLKTINERNHVLHLIDNTELEVQICCGFQRQGIVLKHGAAFLTTKQFGGITSYEMKGELEAIKLLLEGKETLRSLMRRNQLAITAPFRAILLLESIFYLMRHDDSLLKII